MTLNRMAGIRKRSEIVRTVMIAAGLAGLAVSWLPSTASAATARTWTGHGDGVHWSDPANWSGNAVPVDGDSVSAAGVSTVDDISGLHLTSLAYTGDVANHGRLGGALSGDRLVVDTVTDAWDSVFTLPLAAGADASWGLGVYESFSSIDLNGHHLHLIAGPSHELPVRFEGYLTVGAIDDSVGGGALSLDPDVSLTLFSRAHATFNGTITGGQLNVEGDWSATSFDGNSLGFEAGSKLHDAHIHAPSSRFAPGVGVFAYYIVNGVPNTPPEVADLTMDPGSTFDIDLRGPPLVVNDAISLGGSTLVLEPPDSKICPATMSIIDNHSANPIAGQFATIKGDNGGQHDPYAGDTLTAHYDAGDGNDVHVTCALSTPVSVEQSTTTSSSSTTSTTSTTVAGSTTTSDPDQLAATGSNGTPALLLIACAMLALGTAAVRLRRRSSWRAGA